MFMINDKRRQMSIPFEVELPNFIGKDSSGEKCKYVLFLHAKLWQVGMSFQFSWVIVLYCVPSAEKC